MGVVTARIHVHPRPTDRDLDSMGTRIIRIICTKKLINMFRAFWQLAQFRNCVAQIGGCQIACQFRNCVRNFETAQRELLRSL